MRMRLLTVAAAVPLLVGVMSAVSAASASAPAARRPQPVTRVARWLRPLPTPT